MSDENNLKEGAVCSFTLDRSNRDGKPQTVSIEDVQKTPGDNEWQIVDVRTPEEFADGYISSAINIPVELIGVDALKVLSENKKLVLICRSGGRAIAFAEAISASCPEVYVLEGGMDAWEAAELPIEGGGAGIALQRQVFLIASVLLLVGSGLTLSTKNVLWSIICLWVGVGLFLAGATGKCFMAMLLMKLPWNKK